ncbi:MAG TPA: hypothetical protein VN969_07950 [Streptosporangiaceae bacterium]|nr:hypothetical protein [Streptosporangiaceae bacterium]
MTQRVSSRSALPGAIFATGILALAGCGGSSASSAAANAKYNALKVQPPSSGFPQTVCSYSGSNEALTVGLYPAGTTLQSLTSVATGTLTPVPGLGSQAAICSASPRSRPWPR